MPVAVAVAFCFLLLAVLLPQFVAAQAPGDRQDAFLDFTTAKPGKPSGLELEIDYFDPNDPEAKPPAVRKVVERLPKRARFDTSAPALCTASDAELMASGASACSADSVVGAGVLTLDTGVPGPARFMTADVVFLNNEDELIFVNTIRGTTTRVVTRSEVRKRRVINRAPFLPGLPPDGTAIDTVDVSFPVTTSESGDPYIATPRRCPQRGFRTSLIKFTYDDGVKQVDRTRWSC